MSEQIVIIDYTNHRGERRERRIIPKSLRYGSTEWHPDSQWLLEAVDVEKRMSRSFSMKDIHQWRDE
jgi:predicted DNA-binding transcriptional regulator YafY